MALWSTQQLHVSVRGPGGPRDIVVPRPFARIGSHPDSDVVLEGPGVAKRALYLHATPEGLFCLELDVEDAVLEKRGRWLSFQDTMPVGPYLLGAQATGQPPLPTPPPTSPVAWGSAPVPLPVLNVHCQRLLKDKRRFRARLNIVGRRPQCALQLRGSQVSSFHCALYWDQRRLWCIDLLSSNGTKLNGAPIDFAEVQLNDRLDVGEFGLVYYRWSPRRSMQPGWQPPAVGHFEPEALETDDSAPVLDAAAPPAAAAADLALAADLDDADGSDLALDAGDATAMTAPPPSALGVGRAAEQLRQELAEAQSRLNQEREQWQAQLARAERQALAEREAAAKLEAQWRENQQSLTGQLAERAQQVTRLQAELAAAAQAAKERAATESLAAQRKESAAALDQTEARERLSAEVARLTQEREELQAQWRESSQRFTLQLQQSQAEAARLSAELRDTATANDALRSELVNLQGTVREHDDQLAGVQAQLARAQAGSAQHQADLASRQAESQALLQQKEAQLARLAQERNDFQSQWTSASQQLAAQSQRATEQAARWAEQRSAHDAARQEWQAERRAISEELAARHQQLVRLEVELEAARLELVQRREALAAQDAPPFTRQAEPASAAAQPLAPLASGGHELPAGASSEAPPDRQTESLEWQPAEALASNAISAPDSPAEADAPALPQIEPPAGRRGKAGRHEMTTFIGDRLIELESRQRRRSLLIWGSVAAGAVVLSFLILGVWYLLH